MSNLKFEQSFFNRALNTWEIEVNREEYLITPLSNAQGTSRRNLRLVKSKLRHLYTIMIMLRLLRNGILGVKGIFLFSVITHLLLKTMFAGCLSRTSQSSSLTWIWFTSGRTIGWMNRRCTRRNPGGPSLRAVDGGAATTPEADLII